jgi:hypothetical protein
MTSTPENPADGADLAELREEIDELKAVPENELISPTPRDVQDVDPVPHPTDAIGSEKWDRPASDETLEN